MGSNETSIDPEGARNVNARLRATTSKFGDALARMKSAASSHAGCWGNDKFGAAFAKSYVPSADSMLKNSGQVSDAIGSTADAIEKVIECFEQVDQNNANSM